MCDSTAVTQVIASPWTTFCEVGEPRGDKTRHEDGDILRSTQSCTTKRPWVK